MTAALPVLHSTLELCLGLLAGWMLLGLIGLLWPTRVQLTCGVLYPAGALIGAALALVAAASLAMPVEQRVLALGLPDLPLHVRLDALAAAFLFLLGITSVGISVVTRKYDDSAIVSQASMKP